MSEKSRKVQVWVGSDQVVPEARLGAHDREPKFFARNAQKNLEKIKSAKNFAKKFKNFKKCSDLSKSSEKSGPRLLWLASNFTVADALFLKNLDFCKDAEFFRF